MITPGTLLLNKSDKSDWYVLVSYEIVESSIRNVIWFNAAGRIVITGYLISQESLSFADLSTIYTLIEP